MQEAATADEILRVPPRGRQYRPSATSGWAGMSSRRPPSREEWPGVAEQAIERLRPWGLRRWNGRSGRARCPAHDGGDPNLAIRREATGELTMTCHSHGCDRLDILEALGIQWGNGDAGPRTRPPAPTHRPPPEPGGPTGTTATAHAAAVWSAAIPATPDTPAARRLATRGVWGGAGASPLPDSVRWIGHAALADIDTRAESAWESVRLYPPRAMAGAIAYRFETHQDGPAVQLDGLATDGDYLPDRWRRTIGPLGDRAFIADGGGEIAVCEGPTDALALAWHAGALAVAAGGKTYPRLQQRLARAGRPVTVWPDGGDADSMRQARRLAMALRIRGRECRVMRLPDGQDPGDMGAALANYHDTGDPHD